MDKKKVILDWYGNPLNEFHGRFFPRSDRLLSFKPEMENGMCYFRAYTANGEPGDRLLIDDIYTCIVDPVSGKVLYDSRCSPPADATLLPGYAGFEREKQLNRYFRHA